ncbi:DUF2510 domain-containing protein [Arthrobacter sp. YD2]|uniref:DUF2510 domain-containing protein n=1 Tax=Arthrobacter sp. YD2 TaxID=3058046 RepID=UPI0025B2A2CA|nr:DUF2510 domain-containing protein [Arthrobacter sp. YD2]MDN3904621.1 DUF2510 domain-containing protein [Arthrobacter sp. YD2]
MGFKKSTSIKVMPGVTVRVSTTGVSAYAGRTKVAGTSSSSRRPAARTAPQRRAAPVAPPRPTSLPKPGLLAPKEEKALYAYAVSGQTPGLDGLVLQHPVYGHAAAALLGLQQFREGNYEAAALQLRSAIHGPAPIETNPFVLKYLPGFTYDLEIAGGVIVCLPLTGAALTLVLAEALQSLHRGDEAIHYVEQLDPTYPALLSLTELYSDRGDWDEVLRLTDRVPVDSEVTALLAILRSQAHLELGQLVAAKECIKPLTASKKYSENIRFKALVHRSNISLQEKAYGRAVADLEKILAENSQVQGIREAIAEINRARLEADRQKADAAAQKAAEAQRLREDKAAEAQRQREAKAAQAQRAREEKAAAKLAQKATPVIQTGVISLSDDGADNGEIPEASAPDSQAGNTDKIPGFYPDPEGIAPFRYWDGHSWTSRVRMTQ